MFKIKQTLVLVLAVSAVLAMTSATYAGQDLLTQLIDQDIPESWYHAPKLASEAGITEFTEPPLLAARVAAGELPPIEERLPLDPPVIEPYASIGVYGGTAETWGADLSNWNTSGAGLFQGGDDNHFGRATPDATAVVPHLAKGWELSEDSQELTIYLREGLRWSDGHLWTADDFLYWWNHEANNADLNPIPPKNWSPPILDVEKNDTYTVTFHFGVPYPTVLFQMQSYFLYGIQHPAHYLQQFHPAFRDEEELMQDVQAAGFDHWTEYYQYMSDDKHPERARPTLKPYVAVRRTPTFVLMERNPYSPFVDTEGNQLPYIDYVRLNLASDLEMQVAKHITGETTIDGRAVSAPNIPLYRRNEASGGYQTLLWSSDRPAAFYIMPNLNHRDPSLREIFQDVRFRRAMSLAIDREEINEVVFFGEGVPMQLSPVPWSLFYTPGLELSYAEHDPERARELLDEMGLIDVTGDGFRDRPDGERFYPEFAYAEIWAPNTPILELIREHFLDVGINMELRLQDTSLLWERRGVADFDLTFLTAVGFADSGIIDNMERSIAPLGPRPFFSSWPLWTQWANTGGIEGEEPPEDIKELIEKAKILRSEGFSEKGIAIGQELFKIMSEQLWGIGTVGFPPEPIVIKDLHNVPSVALWSDDTQRTDAVYPLQFWLDQDSVFRR